MRKIVLKITFVLCVIIASFCIYTQGNNEVKNLTFENVDALAGGEGSSWVQCLGSGSIECFGRYVEQRTNGLSFDEE